jgi:octaprenyl-diphosphate synthase
MSQPSPGSSSFREVFTRLEHPLSLVERTMRDQLESMSALVGILGDHVLESGGKRMRPVLLLLSAELVGYSGPRRIDVAAAIEMLHTATLLHDDVVDMSDLRRGEPSANALWGNRRAVLGGDFFLARACSLIVDVGDFDVLWVFSNAIKNLADGELLQLERSFDLEVTETHYNAVIAAKSAALLESSCECGAIVAGVTRAERRKVAEYGRELGMAFQLRDDALDYDPAISALGKHPYDDLREGKVTLPLLLAIKRATSAERHAIGEILKRDDRENLTESDLGPALEAVRRYRGIEDTVRRAEDRAARAAAAIAAFPDNQAKRDLLAGADFAAHRDR